MTEYSELQFNLQLRDGLSQQAQVASELTSIELISL